MRKLTSAVDAGSKAFAANAEANKALAVLCERDDGRGCSCAF